jgi:hypothetical protein
MKVLIPTPSNMLFILLQKRASLGRVYGESRLLEGMLSLFGLRPRVGSLVVTT